MFRRPLVIAALLLITIARLTWRYYLSERHDRVAVEDIAPAASRMSDDTLADSEWAYHGPLGELTLRFERAGTLTAISSETESTGRWEIKGLVLSAYIAGADAPHQAMFRKSTDELSGISPDGLHPHTWSATRTRRAE